MYRSTELLLALSVLLLAGGPEAQGQECELSGTEETRQAEELIDRGSQLARPARPLYKQALALVESAMSRDSEDATAVWLASRAHVGLGDHARADSLLNSFLRLKPNCSQLVSTMRQNAWVEAYNNGIRAYQAGQDGDALGHFEDANAIWDDPRSLNNEALLNQQSGNLERAQELYVKSLEISNDAQQTRAATINLAELYREQGKIEETLRLYRNHLAEHPDDVTAKLNLAVALNKEGQEDSARSVIEQVRARSDLSQAQQQQLKKALDEMASAASVQPAAEPSAGQATPHETYSGSGDDVVQVSKPDADRPALLVVQGNQASRHFAVIGYDADRNRSGALVNTTEPYDGIVPLDLPPTQQTSVLQVSANGSWQMDVYPIGAAQRLGAPGSFSGNGDNVLWVQGNALSAEISGNQDSQHFAVIAYDDGGRRLEALVNTTEPYNGTVLLPKSARLLEIRATGSWHIQTE